MESKLNTLDYAPAARRSRRRFRLGCLALLVVAAGIASWHWRNPISERATLLYWQHRCMTYTAPADKVIYEEDPAEFSKLLAAGGGYRFYKRFSVGDRDFVWFVPPEWEKVPYGKWNPGPAFLHERRSTGGTERLVAVTLSPQPKSFGLYVQTVTPVSITGPVPGRPRSGLGSLLVFVLAEEVLRVHAGQVDSADSSHFTIALEVDNVLHTIDGTLADDGSAVLMPRDGRWVPDVFGPSHVRFWAPSGSKWPAKPGDVPINSAKP